jgi:hypothetical protein
MPGQVGSSRQPPWPMRPRCNMQGAQYVGEGEGRTTSLHSLGPHAHHTSICKGVRGVHRVPPSLHWATQRPRAAVFYQSPHRSPHTSQVQLRCNGNGTTPRELPPPGHPPPRHAAHQIRLRPCIPTCTQSASWPLLLLLLVDVFLLLLILLLLLLHHHCFL